MSEKTTLVITAIIGVIGSIAVALITTNTTFDKKLTEEQQSIKELKEKIREMDAEISPITLNGNGDSKINGKKVSEIDKADKRFYPKECKLGKVSHAILNTVTKSDEIKPQPALCTCSDEPNGGRGWICFD